MAKKKINTRQLKRIIKILKVLLILLTRIKSLEKKWKELNNSLVVLAVSKRKKSAVPDLSLPCLRDETDTLSTNYV